MTGNQAGTVLYPKTTLNGRFERVACLFDKGQKKAEGGQRPRVCMPEAQRTPVTEQSAPQGAAGAPRPGFAGRNAGNELGPANELSRPVGSGIDGPNKK